VHDLAIGRHGYHSCRLERALDVFWRDLSIGMPDRDHALACPAHPAADVRLAKHQVAAVTFELPASSPYAVLPKSKDTSRPPAAVSDSHADPPLYLLVCAMRC